MNDIKIELILRLVQENKITVEEALILAAPEPIIYPQTWGTGIWPYMPGAVITECQA